MIQAQDKLLLPKCTIGLDHTPVTHAVLEQSPNQLIKCRLYCEQCKSRVPRGLLLESTEKVVRSIQSNTQQIIDRTYPEYLAQSEEIKSRLQ